MFVNFKLYCVMLLKINLVVIVFLLVVLVFFILVLKIFRILVLRVKLFYDFLFDEFSVYGLVWCDMKSFVLYNFKNVKIFFLIYFW